MSTLDALAERVGRGEAIGGADARLLADSHDLIAIGMMADDVRRQRHGARTTFVRVFEMSVDVIPPALPDGLSAGEIRLVGQPATVDETVAAVAAARAIAGGTVLSGFSLDALAVLFQEAPDLFARLRTAGLDAIAEVRVDAEAPADAVSAARAAGLQVVRLTVGAPATDPFAPIERARQLQADLGGFVAFAPLPRTQSIATPTTGYDDVKVVALARLLATDIPSIQVDWALYGPKLAQVALTVGADDVDGVAAQETAGLGPRRSALEEIRGNIRAAGLEAAERDGAFAGRG